MLTLLYCTGTYADVAPTRELQEKLAAEFKGHCLLEACRQADPQRLKKFLGADVINFKHPYTGDTFSLLCLIHYVYQVVRIRKIYLGP